MDSLETAVKLAMFVNSNNLDGAVIEFEDLEDAAKGVWLVKFLSELRSRIPSKTIALQVFASNFIPNSPLSTSNLTLSTLLDFYIVKYYNILGNDYSSI